MRDFNFFEPYLTKRNRLTKKQWILYVCFSIICITIIILPIIDQIIIKNMEKQTMIVSVIVNAEEAQEERDEMNNKQKQIQEIQDYYKVLKSIDDEIRQIDIINDLFIQTITERVPEEIFFQSINIDQDLIQITGFARHNASIAKFEQNLREFPYFKNVFISNISANMESYIFTISFKVKGVLDDAAN